MLLSWNKEKLNKLVPQIKPHPNSCQYPLINYLELPQVTIFAPSDNVFSKMPRYSATAEDLKRHLIAVKLPSESLVTGPAFTMSGEVINIVKLPLKIKNQIQIRYKRKDHIEEKSINVVQTDIQASNGVIHVIDQFIQIT